VPFSATTTGVGFSGTFTLSNGNRAVRMNFTDFQPGETFTLNVDVDDAAGTTTTGADLAGAIVTVTSGRAGQSRRGRIGEPQGNLSFWSVARFAASPRRLRC
jgi:hypothetical protein